MKILLVFAAFVALCCVHAVPLVPVDNSHYAEGETRYVWMPDGKGKAVLVDLEEPADEQILKNPTRNGANNQYWLYTRQNPTSAQIIVNGNVNSLRNSNYRSNRPLNVLVHGWNSDGNHAMNPLIMSAFFAVQDCNVIVVDWRALANSNYNTAVRGVPNVGEHLARFLNWLISTGGVDWNQVHLIGYSLGAHVVGNAGHWSNGRPARITGLDPAGYKWYNNEDKLAQNDARYVEVIHTDGFYLGSMHRIGNADFYPNGGHHPQPGCRMFDMSCSHGRSTELFASSVRNPNRFVGRRCSNLAEAIKIRCNGTTLVMGNGNLSKSGSGLYGLRTGNKWPF